MPTVTLKLTLGGFAVEVTGPQNYAEKKLEELANRYLPSARSLAPEGRSTALPLEKGGKKLAPGEFVKRAAHKNQNDLALALGYYLEKVNEQTSFTIGELKALGRATKYAFTNISDTVSRLVSQGLMMSSGDKEGQRAYALTASGEEYVDSMIEGKT